MGRTNPSLPLLSWLGDLERFNFNNRLHTFNAVDANKNIDLEFARDSILDSNLLSRSGNISLADIDVVNI